MTFEEIFAAVGKALDHFFEHFWDILATLPDDKLKEMCIKQKMTPPQAEDFVKWLRGRRP